MHLFSALLLALIPIGSTIFTQARTTNGDADFTTDARFAMSKVLLNRRRRMLPTPGNKRPCYTTFFVGNQPPTGFRTNDATNIIYICQQLPDDANPVKTTYYASMFDVTYGISIFSAYVVTAANAAKVGNYKRNDYNIKWRGTQEPGITLQGGDSTYAGKTTFAKGHLAPAEIFSFSLENLVSTFTYTNAVPQKPNFNSGQWAQYEKGIRENVLTACSAGSGDLYLITGISEAKYENDGLPVAMVVPMGTLGSNNNAIRIPRSMWTAGCCVVPASKTVLSNFAVIGNNVQTITKIKMAELDVTDLQKFISTGLGVSSVALFPGNAQCSDTTKRIPLMVRNRKRHVDTASESGPPPTKAKMSR